MKETSPPKWADRLLETFCSQDYIEEVQGDLHEWFARRVKRQGMRKANALYFLDVIRFMRSYRLKSLEEFGQNSNMIAMLNNYLITSWRSLIKNKGFTAINILGLAMGMCSFLLISIYVFHENSYDQFHENKENLYRVQQDRYNKGELTTQWAAGCAAIGPALKENFAEVVDFVKMKASYSPVLSYEDKTFREKHVYYTSENFFQKFTFPLIRGVDSLVLKRPYTVVLSESTAKKYFGEADAVGKTLRHNGTRDFEVTGVFRDLPVNSHWAIDMLFSFETFVDLHGEDARTAWTWDGFYTYLQLRQNTDTNLFESKVAEYVQAEIGEQLASRNIGLEFNLQPIEDIHLTSNYMMEFKPNGDGQATTFLLIIAVFIILIAWVNYINLSTASSMDRSREVGIRKVMGCLKSQLVRQFLVETFLLNFLSLLLAIIIAVFLLPYFNQLSGRALALDVTSPVMWVVLACLLVIGGLLPGLYPAFVLSGFRPVTILKGKFITSSSGSLLRKGLVIFQFLASLVLLVGTLTVYRQLHFMQNQNLGVEIDQTLVLRGPNVTDSLYAEKLSTFKQTLSSRSKILKVTTSTAVPGEQPNWNIGGIRLLEQDPSEANQYRIIGVDDNFIETYGLQALAGRTFDEERANEKEAALLNESALRLMGFEDTQEALDRMVFAWEDTLRIVGVLKDYHQESLKKSFEPLIFRFTPGASSYFSIKVSAQNVGETIEEIETHWQSFFPGNPFDFFFLDDHYDQQYKAEIQFGKVFGIFAALAIFIACLGLFGLTAYVTTQRTKEIGVRKVLGASVGGVITLLSKDFIRLVFFAILLAFPISWWVMYDWLEGFAYKVSLNWWSFALPGALLLGIALTTVSLQALKASLANPVDSLRDE